jgi:hypothetical protein
MEDVMKRREQMVVMSVTRIRSGAEEWEKRNCVV